MAMTGVRSEFQPIFRTIPQPTIRHQYLKQRPPDGYRYAAACMA